MDKDKQVSGVAPLDEAGPEDISYLTGRAHVKAFRATRAGACFVSDQLADQAPEGLALLFTPMPHPAYARTLAAFYPQARRPASLLEQAGISADAKVHSSARLEDNVIVEAGAMIGARAMIGAGTIISAYAVIGPDVAIGRDSFVGVHALITHSLLGDRVVVHAGARIGQEGFGFAPMLDGALRVPQVGRVIIQNDSEIGVNTTIDRGSTRDTTIGEGTKIDNLVQIGHNVSIGRHCFIVSQVGIAGSARIEDYVILAGQVGVAGSAHISTGARVAAKSGVSKLVPSGSDNMGIPVKSPRQFFEEKALLTRLWKEDRRKRRGGNKSKEAKEKSKDEQ